MALLAKDPGLVDAVKVSEFGPEHLPSYRLLRRRKPLILHGLAQGAVPRATPGSRPLSIPKP